MSSLIFLPFYILFIALANLAVGYFVAILLGWGPKRSDRRGTHGVDLLAQPPAHLLRDDSSRPTSFLQEEAASSDSLQNNTEFLPLPEPIDAETPLDDAYSPHEMEADKWDDAVRALASVELPGDLPNAAHAGEHPNTDSFATDSPLELPTDVTIVSSESQAEANFLSDLINQSLAQSDNADSLDSQTLENQSPASDPTCETLDTLTDALSAVDVDLADSKLSQLVQDSLRMDSPSDDDASSISPTMELGQDRSIVQQESEDAKPTPATTVTNNEISIRVENLESLVLQSLGLETQSSPSPCYALNPPSDNFEPNVEATEVSEPPTISGSSSQNESFVANDESIESAVQQSLAPEAESTAIPTASPINSAPSSEAVGIIAEQPLTEPAAAGTTTLPMGNSITNVPQSAQEPKIDLDSLLGTDIESLCEELRRSSAIPDEYDVNNDLAAEESINNNAKARPASPTIVDDIPTDMDSNAANAFAPSLCDEDLAENGGPLALDDEAADIEAAILRSLSDDVHEISQLVSSQAIPANEFANDDVDSVTAAAVTAALRTVDNEPKDNEPKPRKIVERPQGIASKARSTKRPSPPPAPHLTLDEEIAEAVRQAIAEAR